MFLFFFFFFFFFCLFCFIIFLIKVCFFSDYDSDDDDVGEENSSSGKRFGITLADSTDSMYLSVNIYFIISNIMILYSPFQYYHYNIHTL